MVLVRSSFRVTFSVTATFLSATLMGMLGTSGATQAQVPGSYTTSWLGDTYGIGGQPTDTGHYWMQDYIAQMTVQADGTCWTTSPWDEGGRTHGEYKDGQVVGNQDNGINNQSVAVGGHTWSISGGSVTSDDGRSISIAAPAALGLTSDGKLLIADNGPNKQVYSYDVSGTPSRVETIGAPGGIGASYTAGYALPAATNAPAYPAGTYGPGVYHPLKFWNLTGVGEDSTGRLFVSRSDTGGGSAILCFKHDGSGRWILDWRIESYCFVDNVDFDATTDGLDVYGVQEHYKLDYSQTTPGSEWSISSFTADSQAFPNDPRNIDQVHAGQEHGLTSCWYRNVNGHRLLFVEGMTTQMLNIFRFENGTERAIPSGLVMEAGHTIYGVNDGLYWPPNRPASGNYTLNWLDGNADGDYQSGEYGSTNYAYSYGQWIDSGGNLWWAANPIIESKLSSFDSAGSPVYNNSDVQSYSVSGVPSVGLVQYQEAQDRMVICDQGNGGLTGGTLYKIDNWSGGNRAAVSVCSLSSDHPAAISAAGNYAFEVGYNSRGKVWIHNLLDGSLVGTMDVPASLGGNGYSGNVDIGYGIHAFQRANGEYEIAVEDDGWAKVLLYRWNPNGSVGGGGQPDLIVTSVTTSPANPHTGDAVTFTATVKNQGSAATPAGTVLGVGFNLDSLGTIVWEDQDTAALAPGASRMEAVTGGSSGKTWTATAGSHTLTAIVDDVNRIAESNENNNSLVKTFTVTTAAVPAAPTGLAAAAGSAQVNLTWSAVSGATSYSVYRGTSTGGESSTAIKTGLTSTSFTNTGLTNGTTYFYKVKAVNSAGTSGFSNEASAKPAAATAVSYEAEASANTIGNGAFVDTNASASGGQVVRYLGGSGTDGYVTINGVSAAAGSHTLTVYYFTGGRSFSVSVNGGADQTLSCPNTSGSVTLTVTLKAGSNTIKFHNSANYAPDLDRITVL